MRESCTPPGYFQSMQRRCRSAVPGDHGISTDFERAPAGRVSGRGQRPPGATPRAFDVAKIVLAVAAIALAARFDVPVPGSPVPVSLQTLAVLVAAGVLGPLRGAVAVTCYLAAGAAGLPIFADGASGVSVLAGPTGGYLFAMIPAAASYGWAARRFGFRSSLAAALAAHAGILAIGAARLTAFVSEGRAWTVGVVPFLPGGAIKSILASGMTWGLRRRVIK